MVDAHALLLEATDINFFGNVEGLDFPRGVAHVIVCSGYFGNVVLKILEGVAENGGGLAPLRPTRRNFLWPPRPLDCFQAESTRFREGPLLGNKYGWRPPCSAFKKLFIKGTRPLWGAPPLFKPIPGLRKRVLSLEPFVAALPLRGF